MKHILAGLVTIGCLFHPAIQGQEITPAKVFKVHVAAGIQHTATRDQGFSPLIYSGWIPNVYVGLEIEHSNKTEKFLVNYSNGKLDNFYENSATNSSYQFFNYTLYHQWKAWNGKLNFGWSNNNNLATIDFAKSRNFNPRFRYLTSFGAAVRFQHMLSGSLSRIQLEATSHFQLIGFMLQSSYVSASPSGFVENHESNFAAVMNSMELFYPVDNWNWGIWPTIRYVFQSGNSLSFHYRYDMLLLDGAHRFSKSTGTYLIRITTLL